MEKYPLPPRASSLSESMRDIGYSLETAIADIIDNSITAGANRVDILCNFNSEEMQLSITDNGSGMDRLKLIQAMRHGATHPKTQRSSNDLGRFGLGLKTASFSQCRQLVVISRKDGELAGAMWDLDMVSEEDDWVIGILSQEEILNYPYVENLGSNGTVILWQKLDRLSESELSGNPQNILFEKIEAVDRHLSLVFHRYLSGEVRGKKLDIFINGHKLEAFNPFCLSNKATQLLPEEIVRLNGHEITIQPYILPHHSKLSPKEHDYYQSRSEFVSNQGVYIYRNSRLMVWGNWFRLVPKGEATKLARVRIDFPNALDEQWTIDIKKSRAQPPLQVREKLRQIITRIAEQSIQVHSGRGRKLFDESKEPFWVRYAEHGGVRYSLNRDHPVLAAYRKLIGDEQQRLFQEVLTVIEDSIPVEAIYSDYSMTPKRFDEPLNIDRDEILTRLRMLYELLSAENPIDMTSFKDTVNRLKPFNDYPDEIRKIIEEKYNV
jgi:histidine kinase/DNA gyrase B/HSP90-like ATPase